jgi:phage terminase large subunit-like protein
VATAKTKQLHPAEQYARDVVSGKIVAGKFVVLACKRHIHDLRHAKERGYYFDQEAGQNVIDFIQLLKHSKGKWARTNQNILLEPWQQFIIWVVFGWKRYSDGMRRFRTAYLEIARKNGKSTIAAGIGLYLAFADGEPGAEVYSAATKRDQARITHKEAIRMVRKQPALKKYIRIVKDNLSIEENAAKYEPLGADADSTDGLNVHGIIADELHAWKSRDMWDVLVEATAAREQPLTLAITTAGKDRNGICYVTHEQTRKILENWKENPEYYDDWFGIIFCVDDGDDWRDEKVWVKANPNLGVSKNMDYMRSQANKAKEMPTALNSFLCKDLDVWVHGEVKWMNMDAWRKCDGDSNYFSILENYKGRTAFGGLDLSSTNDITAHILVFPEEDGKFAVLPRFWIPEDNMLIRTRDAGVLYETWAREGYIIPTPGNTIDYDWIFDRMVKDANDYDIKMVGFDRWGASRVVSQLQEKNFTMVQFGQGFSSMSPPMKELERLVAAKKLIHGNHPVLSWMADNLVAKKDAADNIKPDKERSREKIDGIVALIMALDLAMRNPDAGESYYEHHRLKTA